MHLNGFWKGEIQPVLPSDSVQIHLTWLISASILIISKTTIAEILLFQPVLSLEAVAHVQPETDHSLCREKFPPTLLLWPWDRAPPYCFGFGRDLGRRAEGLVSGSCSLKSKIPSEFLGAPFSGSADAHTFCVTLELVSIWVLRQLESSPWQWHFCLSWLSWGILFLLSVLEAQLPFSVSYLEGTHQCGISSWLAQNKVLFCFSRVRSF